MSLELYLINHLLKKETYLKHKATADEFFSDRSSPFYKIYQVIKYEYESIQDGTFQGWNNLEVKFLSSYPGLSIKDRELYSSLFGRGRVLASTDESKGIENILQQLATESKANYLAAKLLERPFKEGKIQELHSLFKEFIESLDSPVIKETQFVTDDIKEIYAKTYKEPGLRWRLECLNKSLGSLRKGDFGFIFARPETGKTTLLASEISHMASQTQAPIVWFNNEQQGEVVKLRIFQATLGWTLEEIARDLERTQRAFDNKIGGRIRVFDQAQLHRREVETIVEQLQPSLIAIDQLDKVKGFQDDRNDLELGGIYIWGRQLARYAPTIGVSQAGATAENKRWLQMDDVSNAKTSKQAEADFIIGIGKIFEVGLEDIRYLSLCKNKLLGDPDTDPQFRHGKFEVMIHQQTARYEDIVKWE